MTTFSTLDGLISLPKIDEDAIWVSRDGRWVAWTWYRAGPAADVYVVPSDGSSAPIRLTDTEEDTRLVSWTTDGRAVLVAQDVGGNERDQLFRVDLERPLTMLPLTEANPEFYLRGGQLHPDGRWLIYGANYDAALGVELEPTWIYRHDLESGVRVPLAKPEASASFRPELSPSGSHILYARKDLHPAGRQTWLVDIHGETDREILNFGEKVKTFAHWLPHGDGAVILVETDTHRKLGIWELSSGSIRWLLDDPARDIERAYMPFGSSAIVIVENRGGRTRCSFIEGDSGKETRLPEVAGTLIPLAPVARGGLAESREGAERWIGLFYHSRQPMELVNFDPAGPTPDASLSLSRVWDRTSLTSQEFIAAEGFRWRSNDGTPIHGWLYRAPGEPEGSVIYVHGGPTWHSQDWINAQIQYLVHLGFNVLDPNYRGSTGYGIPFRKAVRQDGWGGREQQDIAAGIEALIAEGIAQPGKIGITGTSFGGYSCWCAITRLPPELIAAAVPICGMTDLVVDYGTTRPDLRPYSAEMMGGTPAEIPNRYWERSPIHAVDRIRGRLLIVQGAQDPNVTPENVRVVERALRQARIRYEVLTFADEGHGIYKPKNLRVLYSRLGEFFSAAFA